VANWPRSIEGLKLRTLSKRFLLQWRLQGEFTKAINVALSFEMRPCRGRS